MEWLQSHLTAIIAPLAILGCLGVLIKQVPNYLGTKALELIEKAFIMGSPADDKLFVALLVWAEERFGPGSGAVKAKFLVDRGISLLPVQYRLFMTDKVRLKMEILFQNSFDRLESVFLAQIAEHKVIVPPSLPPSLPPVQ